MTSRQYQWFYLIHIIVCKYYDVGKHNWYELERCAAYPGDIYSVITEYNPIIKPPNKKFFPKLVKYLFIIFVL